MLLFQKCFPLSVAIATIMASKNCQNGKKFTEKKEKNWLRAPKTIFSTYGRHLNCLHFAKKYVMLE